MTFSRAKREVFLTYSYLDRIEINPRILLGKPVIKGTRIPVYVILHIACAEKGEAAVFLTTDDSLLRKAAKNKGILKVKVENPVKWLMEEIA